MEKRAFLILPLLRIRKLASLPAYRWGMCPEIKELDTKVNPKASDTALTAMPAD